MSFGVTPPLANLPTRCEGCPFIFPGGGAVSLVRPGAWISIDMLG